MAVNLFATVLVTDYFRSLYTKIHSPNDSTNMLRHNDLLARTPSAVEFEGGSGDEGGFVAR